MTASNAEGFGAFVPGVFATTAGTAAVASMGWASVGGHARVLRALTIAAAVTSAVAGTAFLAGRSDLLPPLLAGHH